MRRAPGPSSKHAVLLGGRGYGRGAFAGERPLEIPHLAAQKRPSLTVLSHRFSPNPPCFRHLVGRSAGLRRK